MVTAATLERRLRAIEARRAQPRPGVAPGWLRWATGEEIDVIEALLGEIEDGIREATELDALLGIEIEARATRRMLAGEPPVRS